MLHDEARELAVEAYETTNNIEEVARAFYISKWTLYHMAERKSATGSAALRLHNRGRKRLLSSDDTAHIRTCIELQPDIIFASIQPRSQSN